MAACEMYLITRRKNEILQLGKGTVVKDYHNLGGKENKQLGKQAIICIRSPRMYLVGCS